MSELSVAVLGTGNAGVSLAAILSLQGLDVSLADLPGYGESVQAIRDHGGIDLRGEYGEGKARPAPVTTDLEEALRGRRIVFFAHPAYAHEPFTRACAPFLEDGQILVYISYFGALRMARLLESLGVTRDVVLGEVLSFLYACDKIGPATALVKKRKAGLPFAAFPGSRTGAALDVLNRVFTDLAPAVNCLETSIHNMNPWVHIPGVVLNAGWIEATKGGFSFYVDGMTDAVLRLRHALDREKGDVAARLGIRTLATEDILSRMYAGLPKGISERYYAGSKDAPTHLRHRYLVEDMIYGLVPVAGLARAAGVSTPTMDSIITLASILAEMDFGKEGLDVADLGLQGLSVNDIPEFLETGKRDQLL